MEALRNDPTPQQASPLADKTGSAFPVSLSLQKVSVHYGDAVAIDNADMDIEGGRVMALVGPSGCGKSSLLSSINRMTDLIGGCTVTGIIRIGGRDHRSIPAPQLRRMVGMVFQKPNPFPMSIAENIQFPLREHGVRNRHKLATKTEQVLRDVGLWNEVSTRLRDSAMNLSGGQQQRLCIARALALEPQILLFDEPCSALDPIASMVIEELIVRLKGHYTQLVVTHNLAQARRIADQVSVCWVHKGCGCVVESDTTKHIFEESENPITLAYCKGEAG